jgi:hypothetical protein
VRLLDHLLGEFETALDDLREIYEYLTQDRAPP